jgi:simple sugar transport system permease protein
MIFGNWRPSGALAAAGLFGYADALNLRSAKAVHGLVLFVAIALVALGIYYLVKRRTLGGVLSIVFGILTFVWFAVTDTVPRQFIFITPYVMTLLVLAIASQRLRMPTYDGVTFRKGSQIS